MIFRTVIFPEQHLVTAADGFKIVIKTKNVSNVIHDLFSCSDSSLQMFVVGLMSVMLRLKKYLFNTCDFF